MGLKHEYYFASLENNNIRSKKISVGFITQMDDH